jgi:hypothetical protein
MKSAKASLLLHPLFIISLFLLLLNDLFWKFEYHNWLTGKLSDFAGMILLPVFLMTVFPKLSRNVILLSCASFFIWWKSPLAEGVLYFIRTQFSFPVSRVVDYSDLLALFVLPFTKHIKPVHLVISPRLLSCLHYAMAMLAFISLCSTSVPYRYGEYYGLRENEMGFYENFKSTKTEEEIIQMLKDRGITVRKEQVRYYPIRRPDNLYYGLHTATDSTVQWVPVPQSKDSVIYFREEAYTPFYVIPFYVLDGDTLKNLEFTIATNPKKKKTKSIVSLRSFQTAQPEKYKDFYYGGLRKRYKKHFEQIF